MKHCAILIFVLLLSLAALGPSLAQPALSPDLLEVQVKGVAMDPQGATPIVILEALEGHQAFPVWIGMQEAQAIALEMEGTSTPRPLTHVLLKNILTDLQVKVRRVAIHDLRDNTFYASILLQQGATTYSIDARPSDAIALALGVKAPIYVATHVLQSVRTVTLSTAATSQTSAKQFGMHMQSLDEKLADVFQLESTDGVLVAFVEEGSPAAQQGMRRGDVITGVNGHHIKDIRELLELFAPDTAHQEIVLQVLRDRHPLLIHLRSPSRQ
jgi:bifunctional DNase/RNase